MKDGREKQGYGLDKLLVHISQECDERLVECTADPDCRAMIQLKGLGEHLNENHGGNVSDFDEDDIEIQPDGPEEEARRRAAEEAGDNFVEEMPLVAGEVTMEQLVAKI